jgi:hypothetical protein
LNGKNQLLSLSLLKRSFEGKYWSIGKGVFVVLKMHGIESTGSADGLVKSAQPDSDPAIRGKVINFEVAKCALDHAGRPEQQRSICTGASSRLPNLAGEDWFDWTALCALFGAVALFPFLAMILFR